jgi:hypothetical protein
MSTEIPVANNVRFSEPELLLDISDLYLSFTGRALMSEQNALALASNHLDFRAGLPREDTPWEVGTPFTTAQKQAAIELTNRWGMLTTSAPHMPANKIVVLGAHKASLSVRTQYAVDLHGQQLNNGLPSELAVLSCFRELHSKENAPKPGLNTELDLAISLLESELGDKFSYDVATAWDDLPHDTQRKESEYGVALSGHIGHTALSFISGSVPSGSERATTWSTLESLRSYLGETSCRILFVTTSLHLPYQSIQISRVMKGYNTEVVGVANARLARLSLDSPDADFRIVLQEVGAAIKNSLGSKLG